MNLMPRTCLGPYEILAPLKASGVGMESVPYSTQWRYSEGTKSGREPGYAVLSSHSPMRR